MNMSIPPYRSITVANEFIRLANEQGNCLLTNMKLQKLVYFAHVVYALSSNGKKLVKEPFVAWPYGPVVKNLYEKIDETGSVFVNEAIDDSSPNSADDVAKNTIRSVWDKMGAMSGQHLSDLSHIKGGPWEEAWDEKLPFQELSQNAIFGFYKARVKEDEK